MIRAITERLLDECDLHQGIALPVVMAIQTAVLLLVWCAT